MTAYVNKLPEVSKLNPVTGLSGHNLWYILILIDALMACQRGDASSSKQVRVWHADNAEHGSRRLADSI